MAQKFIEIGSFEIKRYSAVGILDVHLIAQLIKFFCLNLGCFSMSLEIQKSAFSNDNKFGPDIDNLIFSYLGAPRNQLEKVSPKELRWLLSLSAVNSSFRKNPILLNLRYGILKIKNAEKQSKKTRAWTDFKFQSTGAAAIISWVGLAGFVTELVQNRTNSNVFPLFCAASVLIPVLFKHSVKIELDTNLLVRVFVTALISFYFFHLWQESSQMSIPITAYAPMLVSVICVSTINYWWKMNQINRKN